MEDADSRARLPAPADTRIVCRSGNPIDLADLDIANVQTSRSIIVLAPEGDDPDTDVIKTLLAITNDPNRRPEPYHVVAEIRDPRNVEVARMVGKDEVELVAGRRSHRPHHRADLPPARPVGGLHRAARLRRRRDLLLRAAQPDRQDVRRGAAWPSRTRPSSACCPARRRATAQPAHGHASSSRATARGHLGGRRHGANLGPDRARRGSSMPSQHAGAVSVRARADPGAGLELARSSHHQRSWTTTCRPGSEVTVVADLRRCPGGRTTSCRDGLVNQSAQVLGRRHHRPAHARRPAASRRYDHVVLLSASGDVDVQRADARTLVTLLHLRDIRADRRAHRSPSSARCSTCATAPSRRSPAPTTSSSATGWSACT